MQKEEYMMATKRNDDEIIYDQALEMLRTDSEKRINGTSGSLARGYNSPLTQQKNDALSAYLNRDDFKYDMNTDPIYQQYKDKYVQLGKDAMQDTMGQAAALTGGYGSSYAQNVGQQAYNSYLQQLNGVVPELYQMAYAQYQDKGNELLQRYSLLESKEAEDFNRWYQQQRDAVSDKQWDQSFQYQKERDAVSDQRYDAEKNASSSQISEEAAYAMALTGDYSGLASLYGISSTQAEAFAKAKGMTQNTQQQTSNPVYAYQDPDTGRSIYYIDGEKYEFAKNVSPISGTLNPDIKYGTFNDYQPDNVEGHKLKEDGVDRTTGETVYRTESGRLYKYNSSQNRYVAYDGYGDGSSDKTRAFEDVMPPAWQFGGEGQAYKNYIKDAIIRWIDKYNLSKQEIGYLQVKYGLT